MRGDPTRRPRAASAAIALVTLVGLSGAACHKDKAAEEAAKAPPAPSASQVPVDRLAPGELLEGTEKAFGLALPQGVHVTTAFMSAVYATGDPSMDRVANYVRARVHGGTVTRGATGTVFDGVTTVADPQRVLHILVTHLPATNACRLEVRDMTPQPPLPIPPTVEERYRAAGLTPDGKFLDPQHRQ